MFLIENGIPSKIEETSVKAIQSSFIFRMKSPYQYRQENSD